MGPRRQLAMAAAYLAVLPGGEGDRGVYLRVEPG